MRALACIVVLLALPATAQAASRSDLAPFSSFFIQHDTPRLKMQGEMAYRATPQVVERAPTLGPETGNFHQTQSSGISIGPFHAEAETVNGRRHVRYRVDGLTLMGGQIGASLGHGGAMLTLHWSSGD
jgi:hypothetical protein